MEVGAGLFQNEMVFPNHGGPLLGLLALGLRLPPITILEKSDEPDSREVLRWARKKMMRV